MTDEIWRKVVAFPDYEVSNLGRVRCGDTLLAPRGKNRKTVGFKTGRKTAGGNYKYKELPLAVVVLTAFGPPRPAATARVEFMDGNENNYRAANLRWREDLKPVGRLRGVISLGHGRRGYGAS